MKVGIYLKGENRIERFYKFVLDLITKNGENVLEVCMNSENGRIITNQNTYEMVFTSNMARGYRFHKSYYDDLTTQEELDNLIRTKAILGDIEGQPIDPTVKLIDACRICGEEIIQRCKCPCQQVKCVNGHSYERESGLLR